MNTIKQIFANISNEELRLAISEMKRDEDVGIVNSTVVRKYCNVVKEITGNPYSTELFMTQVSLYKEAANRFTELNKVIMEPIKLPSWLPKEVFDEAISLCTEENGVLYGVKHIRLYVIKNKIHGEGTLLYEIRDLLRSHKETK